jgi:hypothetical protein
MFMFRSHFGCADYNGCIPEHAHTLIAHLNRLKLHRPGFPVIHRLLFIALPAGRVDGDEVLTGNSLEQFGAAGQGRISRVCLKIPDRILRILAFSFALACIHNRYLLVPL